MGPLLLSIYINGIVSSVNGCHFHLYVDDSIFYCTSDSVQLAVENLQCSFKSMQDTLMNLKLVLNVDKNQFYAHLRANAIDYRNIHISTLNASFVECVSELKHLGIWLDEKLSIMFIIII